MLSSFDQEAYDYIQKSLQAGIRHPEFKVMGRFDVLHSYEEFRGIEVSRLLTGTGNDEHIKGFKAAVGVDSGVDIEFDTGLIEGDSVPAFNVYRTDNDSVVQLEFVESDDKVYILKFWATWVSPSNVFVLSSHEMLEQHPNWEGRVEIIRLCLNETNEAPHNLINEYGWTELSSYWVGPDGWRSEAPKLFNIQSIPSCLVIHRNKVIWKGSPTEQSLDRAVSALIDGSPLQAANLVPIEIEPQTEELVEKVSTIKALLKTFSKDLSVLDKVRFTFSATKRFRPDCNPQISTSASLSGWIPKTHLERVEALVKGISAIFREVEDNIQIAETYSVARAAACSKCQKVLTKNHVQYVSLVEAGFAICEACDGKLSVGFGSQRLAHPYSLYRIHPLAQHLDRLLFSAEELGKDIYLESDSEDRVHGVSCDNRWTGECEGPIVGVRWTCAHCRDYNFCEFCHSRWISTPSDRCLENAVLAHHFVWHVFIKKPFLN
mmetsp:Transcript_7092/g.12976  ORF Transcript_7092/g.12976 Transcript_7092/m.12976 type:complete len:490 (+) Transcript_7092:117-1586(+)